MGKEYEEIKAEISVRISTEDIDDKSGRNEMLAQKASKLFEEE